MPKAWIQDRKSDYYYKKAKAEEYRSRAAYKLFQATRKYHFIEKGDIVLDLGAAPGGWSQAAGEIVGSKGFVLGVDLNPIHDFPESNVKTLEADITKEATLQQILEVLPGKADAVISDVSPKISGIWEVDHARQIDLAQHSLRIALETLKFSGNLFSKVFQGDLLDSFVREVEQHFELVRRVKPKASRAKSSEIYLLGMNLRESE